MKKYLVIILLLLIIPFTQATYAKTQDLQPLLKACVYVQYDAAWYWTQKYRYTDCNGHQVTRPIGGHGRSEKFSSWVARGSQINVYWVEHSLNGKPLTT